MDVLKSLSRGDVSDQKAAVVAGAVAAVGAYGAYKLLKGKPRVVANGKYKGVPLPEDVYDAVCVGAGPSGSTMAYFFAKARALPINNNSGGSPRRAPRCGMPCCIE